MSKVKKLKVLLKGGHKVNVLMTTETDNIKDIINEFFDNFNSQEAIQSKKVITNYYAGNNKYVAIDLYEVVAIIVK